MRHSAFPKSGDGTRMSCLFGLDSKRKYVNIAASLALAEAFLAVE